MPNIFDQFDNIQEQPVSGNVFDQFDTAPMVSQEQQPIDKPSNFALGIPETAATVATGALAEPIAGLVGIGAGILPGEPGQAGRAIEATREALTFKPRTHAGQQTLERTGELLEPIGKAISGAEKKLGDTVFNTTGSPALAAAATTIPTAIIEALGMTGAPAVLKAGRRTKQALSSGQIARKISEAVPSVDTLKGISRQIYKEIDDAGATIKDAEYIKLADQIRNEVKKAGHDPLITPKSEAALNRISELEGMSPSVTDLDVVRKVAQNSARSLEPAEAAIGSRIIDTIDRFLDNAGTAALDMPQKGIEASQIGRKYKAARNLWGRARKSELLGEAFEKARNQSTGFENGLRVQFRSILNNKKQRRFFNKQELDAMSKVVRGDKKQNIAKLIGRFGFSEGGAKNIIGGTIGSGIGFSVAGFPGAVAVPLIGQISRKLAQKLTVGAAEYADEVIRAGKDARKITQAYLKNTPAKQRSAAELSELLTRPDIDLKLLPPTTFADKAKALAMDRRATLAGTIAAQGDIENEL